jgi:UDP-N-acetylglucosamine:LPS N-acetylglucosamine transferase
VGAELVLQRAADREEKKEENDEPFVVGISGGSHGRGWLRDCSCSIRGGFAMFLAGHCL